MSETYKALTRTYRPRTFEDIVSQEHVTSTLQNAIKQNRLSHAYMFCGPRGVGKTTMARVLARTINQIEENVDGEALNQTLNITEIDAASNNKVEDVHHLRESVRIPPQNGRYKIYIVDEVHMLSKAAFNALLKTLEEPPEHAIFIFATTEPHKVLPTILSRVQRFDFKRIAVAEIVDRLKKISEEQNISIDNESLHVIAKKADGALRDALGLMDQAIAFCGTNIEYKELLQALNVVGSDLYFEFLGFVHAHDADGGLNFFNNVLQEGYDIQEFLVGLAEHLRNLYIAHHSQNMFMVEASDETKARYAEQAKLFSREDLMRILHLVSDTQIKIKDAQQPRIIFEIMLIKLMHMGRSEELNKLLSELDALKKKPDFFLNQVSDASVEEPDISDLETNSESKAENNDSEESVAHEDDGEQPPVITSENKEELSNEVNEDSTKSDGSETVETDAVNFFGTPSLGNGSAAGNGSLNEGLKAKVHAHTQKVVVEETTELKLSEENAEVSITARKYNLEEIKEKWPSFCEQHQDDLSPTFLLLLQRVEPVDLKGLDLTIKVEHSFAEKMIIEQKTDLVKRLKRTFGCTFSLNIDVAQLSEVNKGESLSPYERFKNLQKRDPMIKSIVETFGAELEY